MCSFRQTFWNWSWADPSAVFVECHWCPRTVTPISSLQTDRQVSVTVPRLRVQIQLQLPADPRSPARDRPAITTARCLRRALTSLQGRGSSKVNTYVTTATPRYNSSRFCGGLTACAVLYQFIDLLCPPVVRKMLYFSHICRHLFLFCTSLPQACRVLHEPHAALWSVNLYFRRANAAAWASEVPPWLWTMAVMWNEHPALRPPQKVYRPLHSVRKALREEAAMRSLHPKSPSPQRSGGWSLIKTPARPCCSVPRGWATRYPRGGVCVCHR